MKQYIKKTVLIIAAAVFLVVFCGCSGTHKQGADSDNVIEQPCAEEILEKFGGVIKGSDDNELKVIEDADLWNKMHVQLVYCNYSTYAVIGDIESIVVINPGWGSWVYDYEVADLNEDGRYEMVGYYDWGSGIIRSLPFVLKDDGTCLKTLSDGILMKSGGSEEGYMLLFDNLSVSKDGRSITATAEPALSDEGYTKIIIYYQDGVYVFEAK